MMCPLSLSHVGFQPIERNSRLSNVYTLHTTLIQQKRRALDGDYFCSMNFMCCAPLIGFCERLQLMMMMSIHKTICSHAHDHDHSGNDGIATESANGWPELRLKWTDCVRGNLINRLNDLGFSMVFLNSTCFEVFKFC